jgi:transcriptional regulator GlxA family with amidase domain
LSWWNESECFCQENQESNLRPADYAGRTEEFFESLSDDSPFEVSRLTEVLDTLQRTVFHANRKLILVGPRRYFSLKRLRALRSRLKKSSPGDTKVEDIATDLGFANLGRLPALYRDLFGENPSHTLQRI